MSNPALDPAFVPYLSDLDAAFKRLMAQKPMKRDGLPRTKPISGVYVFWENGKALYVGRSRNIIRRLRLHVAGTPHQASFALRLAREVTGKKATYKVDGGRKMLFADAKFMDAFGQASQRIRKMEIRFVEEPDPIKQALLEVYVTVVLKAPYNDFDTH